MVAILEHGERLREKIAATLSIRVKRSLIDFAESEFVLPDGPKKGERFAPLPFQRIFFTAIDSGQWGGFAITGPAQATKTTIGYVIPALYYLFELGETVAVGVPTLKMADDKWRMDLLPAIKSSGFDDLLPDKGPGSRGGKVESTVTFKNGAVLKFMGGGGGDEERSGFTAKRVLISEVDKLDESSESSREADKITQMIARTQAFGDDGFFGLESTTSFSWGRIWREYQSGTCSSIFCPCPHCRVWVCPGRDSLTGWKDAGSEGEARERAAWCCPACGELVTETQRREMNEAGVLVHKGQKVEWADGIQRGLSGDGRRILEAGIGAENENDSSAGILHRLPGIRNSDDGAESFDVLGDPPSTRTLSMRFDAFNYTFWTAAFVAAKEWRAANEPDEENGEKAIRQFIWALPYDPPQLDVTKVEYRSLTQRQRNIPRGVVPADTSHVIITADPGHRIVHWTAAAITADGSTHICDYGIVETNTDELGLPRGVATALRELRDRLGGGFSVEGRADVMRPTMGLVDSGYCDEGVFAFTRESPGWNPTKGFGVTKYHHPTKKLGILGVGEHCHAATLAEKGVRLIEFDVDYWKSRAQEGLIGPLRSPGAISLFHVSDAREHLSWAKHCTAEELVQEFSAGQSVTRWKQIANRPNHWWDCLVMARLAGHLLAGTPRPSEQPQQKPARPPEPTRTGRQLMNRGPVRRNY